MIERVVHALRALAAMPDVPLARDAAPGERLNELALDYADALRLLADCPQVGLSPEQQGLLERLDDVLETMTSGTLASPSTESAPGEADAWPTVRELARAALRALGQSEDRSPGS